MAKLKYVVVEYDISEDTDGGPREIKFLWGAFYDGSLCEGAPVQAAAAWAE